jgi:hypothetical protein
VAALFSGMVIVLAHQQEGAEHALDHENLASLGLLARLGDVGGIDAIGRLLEQEGNQFIGRLENGHPHKGFYLVQRR